MIADIIANGGMECHVRNANIAQDVRQHALDAASTTSRDDPAQFTPGQFFREAGAVIAVCLALGLLAHILLA
jgi:hypothetical protein